MHKDPVDPIIVPVLFSICRNNVISSSHLIYDPQPPCSGEDDFPSAVFAMFSNLFCPPGLKLNRTSTPKTWHFCWCPPTKVIHTQQVFVTQPAIETFSAHRSSLVSGSIEVGKMCVNVCFPPPPDAISHHLVKSVGKWRKFWPFFPTRFGWPNWVSLKIDSSVLTTVLRVRDDFGRNCIVNLVEKWVWLKDFPIMFDSWKQSKYLWNLWISNTV